MRSCEISVSPAVQLNDQYNYKSHDRIFTTTNYGNSILLLSFAPFRTYKSFVPHLYKSSHKSEFSGYLQFIAQFIPVLHNILFQQSHLTSSHMISAKTRTSPVLLHSVPRLVQNQGLHLGPAMRTLSIASWPYQDMRQDMRRP